MQIRKGRVFLYFFPLFLGLLAFSSCGGKSRVEKLTDRADAYNRSLRWSSLTAAGALMNDENRRTLMQKASEELSSNRIVDYSILDLSMDEKKEAGMVMVEFSFYSLSTQDLMYRQEIQSWKYNAKQRDWFLVETRPLTAK